MAIVAIERNRLRKFQDKLILVVPKPRELYKHVLVEVPDEVVENRDIASVIKAYAEAVGQPELAELTMGQIREKHLLTLNFHVKSFDKSQSTQIPPQDIPIETPPVDEPEEPVVNEPATLPEQPAAIQSEHFIEQIPLLISASDEQQHDPDFKFGKYEVLYVDPPWEYKDRATSGQRGAEFKYPLLSMSEICGLPISKLAAKDCALFMWVTAPLMDVAFDVLWAWGFQFKTVAFTWIKRTTKNNKLVWGMGNWTRANPEFVLLATRGKPKRVSKAVHSVVEAPIMEHSRKPDEVRQRITKLMGDVPKIELFARQHAEGWDATGFDLDGKDIRDVLGGSAAGTLRYRQMNLFESIYAAHEVWN